MDLAIKINCASSVWCLLSSAIRGALLRLRQVAPVVSRRAVQRRQRWKKPECSLPPSATALYTPQRPVYTLFLPTAASAAVLRGCCRSLSGGHGRLNWFVGKTRSYLCHRDTEFSSPQGLSLCEVCRERQATVRQLAGTGGGGRDGHPGEPIFSTLLFYRVTLFTIPIEFLSSATCLSISPAKIKSDEVSSPGGEQGSRRWVWIPFWA